MTIHIVHGEIITDEAYLPLPETLQVTEKARIRQALEAQIQDYLARGGAIQHLEMSESGDDWTPVRTRKEQIKYTNRRFQVNPHKKLPGYEYR